MGDGYSRTPRKPDLLHVVHRRPTSPRGCEPSLAATGVRLRGAAFRDDNLEQHAKRRIGEDDLDFAHPLRAPTSHYSWPMSLPWSRRIPLVLLPQLTERIWQGDKGYPSSPYIASSTSKDPRTNGFTEFLQRCAAIRHPGDTWFIFSERAISLGYLFLDDSILRPRHDGNL
jgi:hypothetical protein